MTQPALPIGLEGMHVCFGLPVADRFACATTVSLVDTASLLCRIGLPSVFQWQAGVSIVQKARNLVAHEFLKRKECNRLFWIDADMGWDPQDVVRILALSQELPCVGAIGPIKMDAARISTTDMEGTTETNREGTFFAVNVAAGGPPRREPPYGLVKVDSMGLCFCCIQREVVERLAQRAPRFRHMDEDVADIFRCETVGGEFRGEDRNFFDDVRALGYEIWLDPEISVSHWGTKAYRGDLRQALISPSLPCT